MYAELAGSRRAAPRPSSNPYGSFRPADRQDGYSGPLQGYLNTSYGYGSPSSNPYGTPSSSPYGGPFPNPSVTPPNPNTPTPSTGPSVNYQDLINQDPLFNLSKTDIAAQGVADRSALTAARQRALIQFGEVPDFSNSQQELGLTQDASDPLAGDITDTIRGLAQQNTAAGLSTTARLKLAFDDALRNVVNSNAAHGILYSGETGWRSGREQLGYSQGQYDARQKLVDYLAGLHSGFLSSERARQAALAAAASAAANRIPPTPAAPTPPPPDSSWPWPFPPPTTGPGAPTPTISMPSTNPEDYRGLSDDDQFSLYQAGLLGR